MDNGNRLIGIDGKKPMILVVDDTPSNLVVISTIIEDEARIAEILRAEEACGFGHGESDCFHSLEVHSLAQRFENAPQEEENHD